MRRRLQVVSIMALIGLLSACSSLDSFISVGTQSSASRASIAIDRLGREPSPPTREFLALNGLRWHASACASIIAAISGSPPGPAAQNRFGLAEVHFLAAHAASCARTRTRYLIEAARGTYALLGEDDRNHMPPMPLVTALYNRAVASLVTDALIGAELRNAASTGTTRSTHFALPERTRELLVNYDRLIDSDHLSISGLIERHRRPGIGAALIGARSGSPRPEIAANYFRRGVAIPLTALLHFDGSDPRLELITDASPSSVRIGAHEWPLNTDYTAPYAWTQHGSKWRRAGFASAFFPRKLAPYRGIYLLEPFAPNKIPVLMIHGLAAGPQAWRNITNEILGTEDLRRHFQIWHYFYPTGQPYLQSAAELRKELAALRASVEQTFSSASMPPLVIIGHSQGGLIARSLVTDPGDLLWKTVFNVPAQQLAIDAASRDALAAALQYRPTAGIARVIFMETPHLGSVASRRSVWLRILDRFVDVPDDLSRTLRQLARAGGNELTPYGKSVAARGGPSPIDSLDANSPLAQAFGRLTLPNSTRYHSIIAAQDEYLTYESAHIAAADSEIVLAAKHQDTDGAASVAEIVRILRLQLREPRP